MSRNRLPAIPFTGHTDTQQAPSKKAGKKLGGLLSSVSGSGGSSSAAAGGSGGGKAKVAKADWSEGLRKKKSAGVPDMTLLSTITNEAINDNLKQRFNNQEIYVSDDFVLVDDGEAEVHLASRG